MNKYTFLLREPLRCSEGILDYIAVEDDYIENYEVVAGDDLKRRLTPDDVRDVLRNLCEISAIPGGVTIDIGCADGMIIKSLNAKTKIAVDIARTYLSVLEDVDLKIRANAEDLPLADAIADTVICTDVIEHVKDIKKASRHLQRILRPGARLLLAAPWMQNLGVYETPEYIERYKKYKYVHLRQVNEELIKECFGELKLIGSTIIRIGMKLMTLEPYPIRFMCFEKS
jgi:ubiquinone/menaquinone biosynthesis C-methylase UbiE